MPLERDFRPATPSEEFHVETMLRAAWQKRRVGLVEADLYRTVPAESGGASLAAALLADSPAAKVLARVQRQIAAFERAWYRANAELRRGRRQTESDFGNHLDTLNAKPAPAELASFPPTSHSPNTEPPTARTAPKDWPPVDEKTGRPLYFVG